MRQNYAWCRQLVCQWMPIRRSLTMMCSRWCTVCTLHWHLSVDRTSVRSFGIRLRPWPCACLGLGSPGLGIITTPRLWKMVRDIYTVSLVSWRWLKLIRVFLWHGKSSVIALFGQTGIIHNSHVWKGWQPRGYVIAEFPSGFTIEAVRSDLGDYVWRYVFQSVFYGLL